MSTDSSWKNKTPVIWTTTFRMVIILWKTLVQTQSFFSVWNKKKWFPPFEEQHQGKGSCLTSKGLAKLLTRIQKLYQITYIFCNRLSSIFIQLFDTNLLARRGTLGLPCICIDQLFIHATHLHCHLPCNYVTSLLAYCRRQFRIYRCIYGIKLFLSIFNSSLKNFSNLEWCFSNIDATWKKKTPIIFYYCNPLWSVFILPYDTNLLSPRETLGLQCVCRAQLIIQATHMHFHLLCNHVSSLLAYWRAWLGINRCIYHIKVLLRYI